MTNTYAQIPVVQLAGMLATLDKSPTPPSFLIKSLPGRGVVATIREAYPTASFLSTNSLNEIDGLDLVTMTLTMNVGKMVVLDLDAPETQISEDLCSAMIGHINGGGRLIIVSTGVVTLADNALIGKVLLTAMI